MDGYKLSFTAEKVDELLRETDGFKKNGQIGYIVSEAKKLFTYPGPDIVVDDGIFWQVDMTKGPLLTPGKTYRVVLNGEEHTAVCSESPNKTRKIAVELVDGVGGGLYQAFWYQEYFDASGNYTGNDGLGGPLITVFECESIQTIDPKYLPNTVATKADIAATKADILADIFGAMEASY